MKPKAMTYQELLDANTRLLDDYEKLLETAEQDYRTLQMERKRYQAVLGLHLQRIKELERQIADLTKPVPPAKVITLRVVKPDNATPGN